MWKCNSETIWLESTPEAFDSYGKADGHVLNHPFETSDVSKQMLACSFWRE
jgi:hypothetical protein